MTKLDRHQVQIIASAVASALILPLVVVSSYFYLVSKQKADSPALTSAESSQDNAPEDVTICQIALDPAKYNRKVVKLTAFLSHGFEDSHIFDPECRTRFSIWHEFGGKQKTGTMYCCGVTAERTRSEQARVEDIPIPLVVDQNFETLDRLLHRSGGTIVHATIVGRFFSGERSEAPNGNVWWGGYGHLGCCSLFMVQQVVRVDPHDRTDVDYGSSVDQPDVGEGCGYDILDEFDSSIDVQRKADDGSSWMFEAPRRVAVETLARLAKRDPASVTDVKLKREAQGRMVYEWKPKREKSTYMVVVRRPYLLAFYAKTGKVAWVPSAAYRAFCNK